MQPPHGPFKISVNRQVTIPAELLRRIDLSPGDSVYVTTAEDIEDALVVIPVEKLVQWIDVGRRSQSPKQTSDHDGVADPRGEEPQPQ